MRELPADCEENAGDEYGKRLRGQVARARASEILAHEEKLQKYEWQRKVFP